MSLSKASGISDITSSESKLKRFTLLCQIIRSERGLNLRKLDRLAAQKIGSPFGNINVTARHIVILQKVSLIEDLEGVYILTGDGKALCELVHESTDSQSLTFGERAIFLKNMFSSVLRRQLVELLLAVQRNKNGIRKKIVSDFFSAQLAAVVWSKVTIERNLAKLRESGKIPTFFENKFTCMQRWLEDIDLLRRINGKIEITEKGETLLNELKTIEPIKGENCKMLGAVLVSKTSFFDYIQHKEVFLEAFKKAYSHFKIDSSVSDIKAIQIFVCIKLLEQGIVMEESSFATLINKLSTEGIIRSVMLGRDGKPGYVSLATPT